SGRPYWYVHQMALGYPIGYCAKRNMNNANTYLPGAMPQGVHMALLGDPTLRAHCIAPPSNVTASFKDKECVVSWSPSPDTVAGYYIFKRLSRENPYILISSDIISDTTFSDRSTSDSGTYQYLIRAIMLEITPSGSYYNLSLGKYDTAYNHQAFVSIAESNHTQNVCLYPNPSSNQLTFDNGENIIQEIKIYDVLGKIIKHILVDETKVTININGLQKGVYFSEIKTAKTTVSKKFIKE
ncbi:MAG: T9SS type A sorting domain-containing protein, partial [Bacteroidales bacterium]|nr:T9SS type A sorting domain-containing protein [Bacteroidales bacterium]